MPNSTLYEAEVVREYLISIAPDLFVVTMTRDDLWVIIDCLQSAVDGLLVSAETANDTREVLRKKLYNAVEHVDLDEKGSPHAK